MSSSSGYTQSSSPLRTSSVPPCVSACSFPSAVLTAQRLWPRMKLTNFPSGEILGSAIASFPCSNVRAVCVFSSNQASAFAPINRIASPFGAQAYCEAARLPRPVACDWLDFSAGRTAANFSELTRTRRCPVATSKPHNSALLFFPLPVRNKIGNRLAVRSPLHAAVQFSGEARAANKFALRSKNRSALARASTHRQRTVRKPPVPRAPQIAAKSGSSIPPKKGVTFYRGPDTEENRSEPPAGTVQPYHSYYLIESTGFVYFSCCQPGPSTAIPRACPVCEFGGYSSGLSLRAPGTVKGERLPSLTVLRSGSSST